MSDSDPSLINTISVSTHCRRPGGASVRQRAGALQGLGDGGHVEGRRAQQLGARALRCRVAPLRRLPLLAGEGHTLAADLTGEKEERLST